MPELRRDPITGRWVAYSPERMRRPMPYRFPDVNEVDAEQDPFAEGNERFTPPEVYAVRPGGGPANGPGWKVRVVPNRYPALRVEGDLDKEGVGFYDKMNGIGAHEVIIETPHPGEQLEDLALVDFVQVLKAWQARMLDLAQDLRFRYLQVFKNFGPLAGATLPHAHSQLVALPVTPLALKEKLRAAQAHFLAKERNLFEDILRYERQVRERVVLENAGFLVFCPFASRFAYETVLMPKRQESDFARTDGHDLVLLADALRQILRLYRRGLEKPSYNLVLVTAPVRTPRKDYWRTIDQDFRWHVELCPRLGGIAGFELGTGCFMNPVLPEVAAEQLRKVQRDA
ncbi:MAG: galactose-1-phosphate uridylyltransferase [Candidatus Methylacidiphilales bacterium]